MEAGTELSLGETTRLQDCCVKVETHCNSFHDAGLALKEIRDDKLYRDGYASFEEFTKHQFGFGKSYASMLISAADTMTMLSGECQYLPVHEKICRSLNRVPDPPKRITLWKRVSEKAAKSGGVVTQDLIDEAVAKVVEPKPKKKRAKPKKKEPAVVEQPPAEAKDATPTENPNGGDVLEEMEAAAAPDPDAQPAPEPELSPSFDDQKAAAALKTRELLDAVVPKVLTYSLKIDRFLRAVGEEGIDTDLIDNCMAQIHAQLELAERRCR
jgi:hypothetical protein